jgi:undecaprenyl-diphosphatase
MRARAVDTAGLLLLDGGGRAATAVSTVARGGAGWAACSGLLALDHRTRRAGRDGLVAWAAAQGLAAGLKALTRRRRPRLLGRMGPATHSSSMPSAHTASGVAYAVAAGAAVPAVGAPLGALALVVGWSRLATRRHFPTDVAAAVLLGVVVGAAVAKASDRFEPG